MAESNADKAAREQTEKDAADAKVQQDADQDTSKVSPVDFDGDPANMEGHRPASGTPPQVVEANPGVEVDADLDRASLHRAEHSAAVDVPDENDDLLKRAQVRAPNLTAAFVEQYGLTDNDLEEIASGLVAPPPTVGPIHNTELHRTPGGWQQTAVGVPAEDAGKNAIQR